ncbi:MAG: hypothetical protein QOJ79_2509 [Actinomycetota bacterium]|nr:hypothetical protein [Actinomycetota bacterium]
MHAVRSLRSRPFAIAAIVAWSCFCVARTFGGPLGDWIYFLAAARSLLGAGVPAVPGGPLHLYAEMPELQFGPPAIFLTMPFLALGARIGRLLAASTMMVAGLSCLLATWRARSLLRLPDNWMLVTGALLFVPAWASVASGWMHLDDAVALTCLAWAVPHVLRGRWWAVAGLLGLGAATKPWAVVLLPLLFALPRPEWAKSWLLAVVLLAAIWAPFLIADPTTAAAIGHVRIPISADSSVRLLRLASEWSPEGLRPVQLTLCSLAALLAVTRGHWPAAALAALAVRVGTDAQTFAYYGSGPVLAAFIWDGLSPRRLPVATAAVFAVEFALPVLAPDSVTAAVRLVATVVLIGFLALAKTDYRVASQLNASR